MRLLKALKARKERKLFDEQFVLSYLLACVERSKELFESTGEIVVEEFDEVEDYEFLIRRLSARSLEVNEKIEKLYK